MSSTNDHVHSEPATNPSSSDSSFPAPPSRPTSHHRRRSSVSTRRESAEMMGFSYSEQSPVEDLDTDIVRRNALNALEGKTANSVSRAANYTQVEIPNFGTFFSDKKLDNNVSKKPPFQLSNRDSFGRVHTPSLTPKDQLHTLLEEEEEDEEEEDGSKLRDDGLNIYSSLSDKVGRSASPVTTMSTPTVNLSTSVSPNPTARVGLKPLTLTVAPSIGVVTSASGKSSSMADPAKRRSSLSYIRSIDVPASSQSITLPHNFAINALPTPELTPITAERPTSPEQIFFQSNHSTLLSRIAELERALATRSRSNSVASSYSPRLSVSSSISSEGPSDELLCLVRDLKAERDDLNRDLAACKTNMKDLEKQISLLMRRVENERRDAWQAREQATRLEMENRQIQRELEMATTEMNGLRNLLSASRHAERAAEVAFEQLKARCDALEHDSNHTWRTPKIRVDSSSSSVTAVECATALHTPLKAVLEEGSEEEDELAHYEDEGEDDLDALSDDSFSAQQLHVPVLLGSNKLSPGMLVPLASPSSVASATPPVTPATTGPIAHSRKTSLDQGWSFPHGARVTARAKTEVDRFFQCLDDFDQNMEDMHSPGVPQAPTQSEKNFFSFIDDDCDDGIPPFVFPVSSSLASDGATKEKAIKRKPVPPSTLYEGTVKSQGGPTSNGLTSNREASKHLPRTPESAEHNALQTPRKSTISSIPKFNASPSGKPSASTGYPVTPTSIPRARTAEATHATVGVVNKRGPVMLSPSSPTRLPISKTYGPNNTQFWTGGKSNALSGITSYLPWSGWSAMQRTAVSDDNVRLHRNRVQAPTSKSSGSRGGNGLVLL